MATIITIDWTDPSKTAFVAKPEDAKAAKKSCIIFINNLDGPITITGEKGLFREDVSFSIPAGEMNAAGVKNNANGKKDYDYMYTPPPKVKNPLVNPRTGTIDIS
jgi:hypothetical protein